MSKIPEATYIPINRVMGPDFIVPSGQAGVIVVDEWAEREIGAGIGWATNTAFAWYVIRVSRRAFNGPNTAAADLDAVIVEEDGISSDDV